MRKQLPLADSAARTLRISVADLDNAWARATLGVRVGRTKPMPPQLFMVMRGERPRMKRRTKENNAAYARMKAAQDAGKIADVKDILHAMPGWTKPPPNPYPVRKIGRPQSHRLLPVVNQQHAAMNKPMYGSGFWTSTYLGPKQQSDWVRWCAGERFPYTGEYRSWVVEVDPDAWVLEIDGPESCEELFRLGFMYVDPYFAELGLFWRNRPQIDFEKLAAVGVDGVHLTERGNHIMHLNIGVKPGEHEYDFNSWDSESTLWMRWCFTRVRVGPKVRIPERGW